MQRPVYLLISAVILLLQAATLVVLAVMMLADLGGGLVAGGIPGAVLFLVVAAGIGFCAWSLYSLNSWARAPAVVAQLMLLGVAWDFREGTPALSILFVVIAAVVLLGIFHPRSIKAVEAAETH